MSLNVVLGCGIVIYQGFIFPLKKSHKKIRAEYQTMNVPYENSFLHAINILWLQEPLIPHFLLSLSPDKSPHYVLVTGHTDAQCVCV